MVAIIFASITISIVIQQLLKKMSDKMMLLLLIIASVYITIKSGYYYQLSLSIIVSVLLVFIGLYLYSTAKRIYNKYPMIAHTTIILLFVFLLQ